MPAIGTTVTARTVVQDTPEDLQATVTPEATAVFSVVQDDPTLLHVQVGHDADDPKYVELADGVNTAVWTPAAGSRVHLKGMILSAKGAGDVVLYRDATPWARVDFNEKKTVPIFGVFEVMFGIDEEIKATWTAFSQGQKLYITLVGHEHAE